MEERILSDNQIDNLVSKKKRLLIELDGYEYGSSEYIQCEKEISEIENQLIKNEKQEIEINSKQRGTRENPFRHNEIIYLGRDVQMNIKAVIRGKDAYRLLVRREPNIINSDNKEYIYIQAEIKNVGNSRLLMTGTEFSVVNGNGVESEESIWMGEHFKPMHGGASQKANIYFKVDKLETSPLLFFEDYQDGVWIDLSTFVTDELLEEINQINGEEIKLDECQKGIEAYNNGEVEKAREILKKAALSGNYNAYESLGDIHMNSQKYDAAIICYEKALEGGINTVNNKLQNAKNTKKNMEMNKEFQKIFDNPFFNNNMGTSDNVQENTNIVNDENKKNVSQKPKEEVKVSFNLEQNRKESSRKIALYVVGTIICAILAIVGYSEANLWVMLGFGFATFIVAIWGIDAYQTRCPRCEKLNAMVIVSSKVTGRENINKVKRVNDYNREGKRVGSHDEWVSGVRTHTHDIDECMYCKYRRAVKREKDSI